MRLTRGITPTPVTDIVRADEPERTIPAPAAAELYNLEVDPLEKEDLADAEPVRLSNMLSSLESWFEEVELERTRETE